MTKSFSLLASAAMIAGIATVSGAPAVTAQETEQPKYSLVTENGAIEVREYAPMIVAEATVRGERGRAMNGGFRMIADYIFGNNISSDKIAMTSPVTQQASEKIAMTSPVTQQSLDDNIWQVRFIMPSEYTMETLPRPATDYVELFEIPAKRFAVIRFSGLASSDDLARQTAVLEQYLADNQLLSAATPTYAFYDGPWTRPANRRNEVMIELAE